MKTLILASALLAAQCNPSPKPEPATPAEASCAGACERLRQLGCPEAAPTTEGASCEAVCANAQESPAPLPIACIAHAVSCAQAEDCQ